jgi:hypothetical protein
MKPGEWRGSGGGGVPGNNARNRVWTLQEIVGNNVNFVNYHGEGQGSGITWFTDDVGTERGSGIGNFDEVVPELESVRSLGDCVGGGLFAFASTGTFTVAGLMSRFTTFVATSAFNSNLICPDAKAPSGSCVNLLKVIGGVNSASVVDSPSQGGGIITQLTSGIYIPLLAIIVGISGLWVLWIGIVKRQYREAMWGAIWVFFSAIVGMVLLFKPMYIAKAPMAVSNTVVACVIGSFNGDSCTTSSSSTVPTNPTTSTSENICKSSAAGLTTEESAAMTVNGLSCSIWKAFILQPYSRGSFGKSFEELDCTNPQVSAALNKAGIDRSEIFVNLATSSSYNSQGSTLNLDSNTNGVCNLAAYQLFLMTDARTPTQVNNRSGDSPDTRWYNLILTVKADSGLWSNWEGGGFAQVGTAMLAVITATIGGVIIIVISLFALVYYLISVLMMAFSPLFLLFAVHPGRGKKIFLGYAEKIISNVLKYIASALFLIVTIQLYGAVLGTSSNGWLTLLFVLILSGALFMYRKEVVELIGRVNTGGEQLSSKLTDTMGQKGKKAAQKTGRIAGATVGSSIGARMAVGSKSDLVDRTRMSAQVQADANGLEGEDREKFIAAQVASATDKRSRQIRSARQEGLRREIKTGGTGVVGRTVSQATRQFERTSSDHKRDIQEEARDYQAKASDLTDSAQAQEAQVDDQVEEIKDKATALEVANAKVEVRIADEADLRKVEDQSVSNIATSHPEFAKMTEILNRLERLNQERAIAQGSGNMNRVAAIDAQMDTGRARVEQIKADMKPEAYTVGESAYKKAREETIAAMKLDPKGVEEYENDRGSHTEALREAAQIKADFDEAVSSIPHAVEKLNQTRQAAAEAAAVGESLNSQAKGFVAGEIVTTKERDAGIAAATSAGTQVTVEEYRLPETWKRSETKQSTPQPAKPESRIPTSPPAAKKSDDVAPASTPDSSSKAQTPPDPEENPTKLPDPEVINLKSGAGSPKTDEG